MSDRPRTPGKDDWEDDLELTDLLDKFRDQPDRRQADRDRDPQPPEAPRDYDSTADEYLYGIEPDPRRPAPTPGRYPDESADRYPDDPFQSPRPTDSRSSGGQEPFDPDWQNDSAPPDWVPGERTQPYPGGSARSDTESVRAPYPGADERPPRASSQRQPRKRRQPSAPSISIPTPTINDGVFVGFIAASLVSLMVMIAAIALGIGDLPEWIPIHIDASGDPDQFGTDSTLWRIPFGIFMTIIMALVISAVLWKHDRFASRFALAGTAIAQVLAWVAVIDFLW